MNHVYRSVWSEITGTFVAAAETIKGRGKRSGSRKDASGAPAAVDTATGSNLRGLVLPGARLMALEQRYMFDGAGAVDMAYTADALPEPDQGTESTLDPALVAAWCHTASRPVPQSEQEQTQGSDSEQGLPEQEAGADEAEQALGSTSSSWPEQFVVSVAVSLAPDAAEALDGALDRVNATLFQLAGSDRFLEVSRQSFQNEGTADEDFVRIVDELAAQMRASGLGLNVELRSGSELQGALGAYARVSHLGDERIYLNADWISEGATAQDIERVLLEEFGHALDQRLHDGRDSVGDEGELFANLMLDLAVTQESVVRARSEFDHATLQIEGVDVRVETAVSFSAGSISIADTAASDAFVNRTGTFTASLSGGEAGGGATATYALVSPTSTGTFSVGGATYQQYKDGTYGRLYLNTGSGDYAYDPNDQAINALGAGRQVTDLFDVVAGTTKKARPLHPPSR